MDNQHTKQAANSLPTTASPTTPVTNHQSLIIKNNNFLVTLLSLLLLLAVGTAGFFAYQTQKLVQELRVMSDESKPTTKASSTPQPTDDPSVNWKTYTDKGIGYTVKYPTEAIPSKGNCDSFVYPSSEEERNNIQSIKNSGIEIGYSIKGLEFAFCIVANPNQLTLEEFAKNHSPKSSFMETNFNSDVNPAMVSENEGFVEYFLLTPDQKTMRVWYRYGSSDYKNIAQTILSTFKFIEPETNASPTN